MDESLALLELTNYCLDADDDTASLEVITEKLQTLLPFNSAIIGVGNACGGSLVSVHRIHSHGNNPWLSPYSERGFFLVDPIVRRALRDQHPFSWSDAYASHPCDNEHYAELKSSFGIHEGCAASYQTKRSGKLTTLISLACSESGLSRREQRILAGVIPHIHEVITRRMRDAPPAPALTPRELEILNWVKEGKSNWDIGMLLSISERTVKFHIANIYTKLKVCNRAQAVATALQHRLIQL